MVNSSTSALCTQIVDLHFGSLTSRVASALLTYGRLTLLNIARYASLKPRTVRAAVIVLVQHNLAWHAQSDTDGEVIEFNTEECLLRLRYGRFAWQAEKLYGKAALEIVSLVMDHGKLQANSIIEKLCSMNKKKETTVFSQALYKLVSNSYLVPATELSQQSPHDKLLQYETEEKAKIKNFPTAKELVHAKETAAARLNREYEEAMKTGLIKRKVVQNGRLPAGKKKTEEEEVVNDEVFLRLNGNKFNIHMRDKIIEDAVRERFNESAALVMRAVLQASESKSSITDSRSANISLMNVLDHISDENKVMTGLSYSKKRPHISAVVREYLGILASADNPSPAGRASSFISVGSISSGKISVELEIIARRLRRRVLEAVVRERYGDEAVRVIRLLLENGKMGGDQIAKVTMMPVTSVRPLLTLLSADSLVSIQEVPKGADRNPQRTIYLWYVDLQKSYSVLLVNFYKTLYNIGARRRAEQEDPTVKAVLAKSERTDVREDPSLLSRVEREVLVTWEGRRDKLSMLEMRVEEAVLILRDLSFASVDES